MRRAVPLIALLLLGCLPDLSQWRVLSPDEDGGPPPRRDGGFVMPASCDEGAIPIGAGYVEGFEGGAAGWGVTGQNASWGLGTPRGPVVLGAAEGVNAWMAGLDAPYSASEDSYVVSPCFDASASGSDLFIALSRSFKTESSFDRASVELSVDGGVTWATVPGPSTAGWYSGDGWSGEGAWREAFAFLPGTAGQPRVQVRVYFHSDTSNQQEGFAFDDVRVQPSRVDLAVSIVEDARCGFATATITNVGGAMVPSFEVTTSIDGVDDIRTFDSPLAYGESREVELGAPLGRNLGARAFAVGDVDPGNDAASFGVTNVVFGSGGYFSDFEADGGGFVVGGDNASWEWGTPAGALFTSAASGSRAWVTNLDGDYNQSEQSWIQTPCYDMRGLVTDPTVSFMQVFRTEDCCDTARVEVSVDGQSFRRVGSTSSGGTNWYNDFDGWRGSSGAGAWRNAQHPLTSTAGFEFVRIRFVMDADGSQQFEGFGVDDVQLLP